MQGYDKKKIAKLVKDARIAKGFTQQELSDLAGISLRSVQRIESADVFPRSYTMKLLAEKLDFSIADFNENVDAAGTTTAFLSASLSRFNVPRKLIVSISSGLLLILFVAAFLSQSARFPETHFEFFVFLMPIVIIYALLLFKLWK